MAEIFPDLAVYDEERKPYTVRYHLLGSMLLNEIQKEHRQIHGDQTELKRLAALHRLPLVLEGHRSSTSSLLSRSARCEPFHTAMSRFSPTSDLVRDLTHMPAKSLAGLTNERSARQAATGSEVAKSERGEAGVADKCAGRKVRYLVGWNSRLATSNLALQPLDAFMRSRRTEAPYAIALGIDNAAFPNRGSVKM